MFFLLHLIQTGYIVLFMEEINMETKSMYSGLMDVLDGLSDERKVLDHVAMVLGGDPDLEGMAVIVNRSNDSLAKMHKAIATMMDQVRSAEIA